MAEYSDYLEMSTCDFEAFDGKLKLAYEKATQAGDSVGPDPIDLDKKI